MLMRVKSFLIGLVFLSLLYAGCGKPSPPTQIKSEVAASPSPALSHGGFPLLAPVKGTIGLVLDTNPKKFTFAVFGDNQGGQQSTLISDRIFEELRNFQPPKPMFAFCLGDIVQGKHPGNFVQEYNEYIQHAKQAGVPIFNAPGNHEMDDINDIPSAGMHKLYEDNVAPAYGAFNYGNSRFIALNTEDVPAPDARLPLLPPCKKQPCAEFSYMGDTQLQQLDEDLKANTDKTHIFIMMHYPIKPQNPNDSLTPESLKKLTAILAKYKNISYVLASHEHLYYNPQEPGNISTVPLFKAGDPTRYLVSGGAGAQIYVPCAGGGFYHYLVFEVDGDTVSVKIHRVGSKCA